MKAKPFPLLSAAALAASALAKADDAPNAPAHFELEPLVVTASPLATEKEDLITPVDSLSGEALARSGQSSLGGTLDGAPGVHSTYFGPGAGRPVIRGFDGDRVRILNQGTDAFDVSQTSPDHGVSVEPLFARSIEVVRGPATLLYGNAAIGGVVNVIGKELPRQRVSAPIAGELQASYGSAADERVAGLALEGGAGAFAWSAGYLDRQSGDVEIPGFAESIYQRRAEAEEAEGEEDEGEAEEESGSLHNSFVDTRVGYLGGGWFGESASLALAVERYDTQYGVPGHAHEHEGEHEEVDVSIDLEQAKYSLRGELLDPVDWLKSLELQIGYGDYQHKELEGAETGTIFSREGYELRLTGVHRAFGELSGAVGLHLRGDAFSAVGEEAFIPSNDTDSAGLFVVERLEQNWGSWEFGGRVETTTVEPERADLAKRDFNTVSGSAGFLRRLGEATALSANLSYAERAPNASELFAFGPHVGTRGFEIGDADLDIERSTNLDLTLRRSLGFVTGALTAFHSSFDDYVYLERVEPNEVETLYGDLDTHGLDVYRKKAVEAVFQGFELELRFHLLDEADRQAHFDLMADQTRATNETDDSYLPRIPTRRIGGRYEYARGPWLFGIEGRHHFSASRLAPNELPTDSYFLWGADIRYRVVTDDAIVVDLYAQGRNLGDEEARPHTSFLKDLVPLPGRNLEAGIRTAF